jgi:subtilisin family serine protease
MKVLLLFSYSLILCLGSLSAQNDLWRTKIDPTILTVIEREGKAGYLVVLETKADLSAARQLPDKLSMGTYVYENLKMVAEASQAPVLQLLTQKGLPAHSFLLVNAIYTESDMAALEEIARLPEVKDLLYNFTTKFQEPVVEESSGSRSPEDLTWGILKIKADSVWMMGYQGQGVVVAGHDTGIDWEHPAIKSKYRGWNGTTADHNYNWHDAIHTPANSEDTNPCGFDLTAPCDDNSHGTHTLGTMVGSDGSNQIGVAPAAQWIGARNMDEGNGTLFSYIEGFEWFLAPTDMSGQNPDPAKAPHVINNSWYCSTGEGCNETNFDVLEEVVNNVRAAGIVVVVSAGNSGPDCNTVTGPPAFFESSFSIGATNDQDSIANFSSRGSVSIDGSLRLKPNVSAPGAVVYSCILNGGYGNKSGTSMSSPHVAGVVALMISARPELAGQVEEIETILEQTADYLYTDQVCGDLTGNDVPNYTYGYGRINALEAVKAALEWGVTGTTPVVTDRPMVQMYPNPFEDVIHLEAHGITGDVRFSLYDASGRVVMQQSLTLNTHDTRVFSLASLLPGIYAYEVVGTEGQWSGKVSKIR